MFEIEKDIPIPSKYGLPSKYPFREMHVGDSFRVDPVAGRNLVKTANMLNTAAHHFGQKHPGRAFTIRTVGDHVRIWRTA